jgi:hypothetical protein
LAIADCRDELPVSPPSSAISVSGCATRFLTRLALELLQTLTAKELSIAVLASVALRRFDATKAALQTGRLRKINCQNSTALSGGAIAVLNG